MIVTDIWRYHKAKSLTIPENIVRLFCPPYSPAHSPIEHLWHAVKDQLAWILVPALDKLAQHGETIITHHS